MLGVSERFACGVTGQHRATQRHPPVSTTPGDLDAALRKWLRAWAKDHPRRGFRPAYHDARAEGWNVNHKKLQRLWREEGLRVSQRRRRKRHGISTAPEVSADAPDQVWAVDFQFDVTTDGRPIKIVSIIDEHTRESLGDLVERSITAEELINELERLVVDRGAHPAVLRCDNGPELACAAMSDWAARRVGLHFIPPGEPWRNGYVESFNSRIRDECLNINSFWSLAQARVVISDWKHQYNHHRRHSALGYRTPAGVRRGLQAHPHPGACIINGTAIDVSGSMRAHENYWTILHSTLITRAWRARELLVGAWRNRAISRR
jgi:transposase InsO family protein